MPVDPSASSAGDSVASSLSPLRNLRHDIPAALVVALVAIPLCLGVALASGAPLLAGVLAGIVGGIVVPFFSRSALSVSGPAAGLTAIILVALQDLHSFSAFLLAVVIAGAIQLLLGFLRAGSIAYFFPSAVIEGMLAAIGIILIMKQFPYAVGFDLGQFGSQEFASGTTDNTFSGIYAALAHVEWGALLISLLCLGILIVWDVTPALKRQNWFSGPLVAVLAGTLLNLGFSQFLPILHLSADSLVQLPVIHSIEDVGRLFQFPDWRALSNQEVWVVGVTIAIVASLESLLSIEAADKLDPFKRRTPLDGELIGQGVANLVSGVIGGLPVTAVIVRSSANITAGGRTKASAFLHGIFLLIAVIFLARALNLIPLASLATVLIVVGFKLAHPRVFRHMFHLGKTQYLPFVITIVAVLFTDLLIGVGVGLVVGLFFVLRANYHSALELRQEGPGNYLLCFKRELTFVNKARLARLLDSLPNGSSITLDGAQVAFIDHDVLEVIRNFEQSAPLRQIHVYEQHFDNPVLSAKI
ncbi:SulP family inorganic anion transporter [Acidithiobacillus sp. IBUN Pt1247-S3]|uniref:SulP family inorganic anion transporter n=1 Tax=Acidithiobacillus sp. IBUN Pt1247-S3 TaxID=3166642 RepID=UPI0034E3C1DC